MDAPMGNREQNIKKTGLKGREDQEMWEFHKTKNKKYYSVIELILKRIATLLKYLHIIYMQ